MRWPDELRDASRASGWLNKLLRKSRAAEVISSDDIVVSESTHGTTLRIRKPGMGVGGSSSVQRFKVITHNDDYLACAKENADGSLGAAVNVAKPRSLRLSTWNGQTIGNWSYAGTKTQRTATYVGPAVDGGIQPGDSLVEVLTPDYEGASELIGSEVTGETGVLVGGSQLTWIDFNIDKRGFAAQRDRVEACKVINNVQVVRKIVIEGGPSFA